MSPSRIFAGWWVVVGAFLCMLTGYAVAYSFAAFFGVLEGEFGARRGETSLVFSITAFCWFALGWVSGRATDRFGPRPVLLVGAVALLAGLLATSAVQSLWTGYLSYGLGVGIAVACGYVPMVAVVGAWFDRWRGTAVGIAVADVTGVEEAGHVSPATMRRGSTSAATPATKAASAGPKRSVSSTATRPP